MAAFHPGRPKAVRPETANPGHSTVLGRVAAAASGPATAGPYCFGVRLFRQYLTGSNAGEGTREWQSWISNGGDDIANAAQASCQFPFIGMGPRTRGSGAR